ncbi:MAG TPA: energy transducer TonB [Vicinamibacterales bacterium]|jgi:TonB family protein
MKPQYSASWIAALVAACLLTSTGARAQGNDLTAARDLYASAAYDEALTLLNRLHNSDPSPVDARAIEQYRAFCLLALGRPSDAQQAIEAVVNADPNYHPAENEVSPRVRAAFTEVRRRMLPTIVQQKYALAKAAYDRKDWATAAVGFSQVLVTLADSDVGADANRPPLSDIRTLAVGFEELSAKAAAPPPPPPAPAPAPVVAPPPPAAPVAPHVFSAEDQGVVPPIVISQTLPAFRGMTPVPRVGRLEVVIDETGAVESAVMSQSVTVAYDRLALAAARNWRFAPATVNGAPVKFRKIVQVTVKPTT